MSTWRDEASQQVKDDLDGLLNLALSTGKEQLDAAGEFYPFTVSLPDATGTEADAELGGTYVPAGEEFLAVEEVHEGCWQTLQSAAGVNRAAAVVTDVGGPDGDAIAVALEHRDGPAIEVYLPYVTQRKVGGKKPAQKHRYGDLVAAEGTRRIWP